MRVSMSYDVRVVGASSPEHPGMPSTKTVRPTARGSKMLLPRSGWESDAGSFSIAPTTTSAARQSIIPYTAAPSKTV